ncbi:MAG: ABC-2 family transporter protein [Candidatus Paceibacterota bacterium]|jgi:ABC-2 type transport system permease protein
MNELKFALYAIKKNIQSSAELRTSFLMNVIGMALNNIAFIILWVFFVKSVGIIGGWTASDIIGMQGFLAISYGIVFSACGGLRKLADYVSSGSFDRFMLSPKNLLLRIATSAFGASALGDLTFGIVGLIAYAFLIHASVFQILLAIPLIIISTLVFFSAVVTVYSFSFFFVDANTVTTGLFELFMTPTLFHGGAFQGGMRFVYTFIIPSLLVGALPIEAIRNFTPDKIILLFTLSIFWFFLSINIFKYGVRKYESANFMTFGG